ncbi:hypothetical protein B0H19DRAFT_1080556 [Mycena capillaripes]|nr:hypothetical protein B0H19DRAFT_1080556 [Mycena capillaripes]
MSLFVHIVEMHPLLPRAESLNHTPTLWDVRVALKYISFQSQTIESWEFNYELMGFAYISKKSKHMGRLLRLDAPWDTGRVDNGSLLRRSLLSIHLEDWSAETFALALKSYGENWKLEKDALKMIRIVIQPTLYANQSIDTIQYILNHYATTEYEDRAPENELGRASICTIRISWYCSILRRVKGILSFFAAASPYAFISRYWADSTLLELRCAVSSSANTVAANLSFAFELVLAGVAGAAGTDVAGCGWVLFPTGFTASSAPAFMRFNADLRG